GADDRGEDVGAGGSDAEREHAPIRAVGHDRGDAERGEREATGDPEKTVEPLDLGGRIEARKELPVAGRPIGAAEARTRHTNNATPDDDEERGEQRQVDERAISGTERRASNVTR